MNYFWDTIKQSFRGQSVYRVLSQQCLKKYCPELSSKVIDLAGGGKNSYFTCLKLHNAQYRNTDIKQKQGVDIVLDITRPLPLPDEIFDSALLFNSLYIFEKPVEVLREINRILKKNGILLIITPFVFNLAPEPTDYWRFTNQGLRNILQKADFKNIEIIPFGERFTVCLSALNKFLILRFLRPFFYLTAMFLDKLIPRAIKKSHPLPLGYLVIARS